MPCYHHTMLKTHPDSQVPFSFTATTQSLASLLIPFSFVYLNLIKCLWIHDFFSSSFLPRFFHLNFSFSCEHFTRPANTLQRAYYSIKMMTAGIEIRLRPLSNSKFYSILSNKLIWVLTFPSETITANDVNFFFRWYAGKNSFAVH